MKIKVKCKMCGCCCKAIALNATPQRLIDAKDSNGYEKLHKIFKKITEEEAFKRNRYLKETSWKDSNKNYYKCTKYKNGLCSIHFNKKPFTCSEFPYYKDQNPYGIDSPHISYSKDCPYNLKENQALYNEYKLTSKHYKQWKMWKDNEIAKKKFLTCEEAEKMKTISRDEL